MDLSNDNIIHIKKNGIGFLQFKKLLEYKNIVHAFSLKPLNFKAREGRDIDYKKLFETLDIDFNSLVKPNQTHTDNVLILENKINKDEPDMGLSYLDNVDGIITNKAGITLSTTSADCICLIFYDDKNKVIANVHSGWRGTFEKIAQKTVIKMIENFKCDVKNIMVFIEPSIRQCHFEVDEEVMLNCKEIFDYTNRINDIIKTGRIYKGKQKYNIDNILINKIILQEVGILKENIYDSNICSFCNSDLIHSRRVDGENYGLGTTIVLMK